MSSCQVIYILSKEFTCDDKITVPESLSYFAAESKIPFLYTFTEFSAISVPMSKREIGVYFFTYKIKSTFGNRFK